MWLESAFEAQKQFLDLLIPRYIDVPGIAWDIYNEPMGVLDDAANFYKDFNSWALRIIDHIRQLGDTHAVTVGDNFSTGGHEEASDYLSWHSNFRWAGVLNRGTGKPELLQEVWMDRPPTPSGNQQQLNDMRTALINTYRTGLAGFCPWQWTEQLAMWQAGGTFRGENWDDFLGACVRYDQSIKPSGRFYRDFNYLFSQIELRYLDSQQTVDATKATLENGPGNTSGFVSNAVSVPSVPSATVHSSDGQVVFTDPTIAKPGDFYILHSSEDNTRHRGIACSWFRLSGCVVEAESGGDVWFVLSEGKLNKIKVRIRAWSSSPRLKSPRQLLYARERLVGRSRPGRVRPQRPIGRVEHSSVASELLDHTKILTLA